MLLSLLYVAQIRILTTFIIWGNVGQISCKWYVRSCINSASISKDGGSSLVRILLKCWVHYYRGKHCSLTLTSNVYNYRLFPNDMQIL